MTRRQKWLLIIAGAFVFVPVASLFALWRLFTWNETPSNIVDFAPTTFQAKAESKFFYSIGDELKYSDQIAPESPTLMRGRINRFLVSPDNQKIAVVANGRLAIVGTDSILREVTAVDSILRNPKPIGRQFFRDDNFEWSRDSGFLYLIRDEYYASHGAQLSSSKGELWKYSIESGALELVLKPFPAYRYFLGAKPGVYFSTSTDGGDTQLRYFDGRRVTDVGELNDSDFRLKKPAGAVAETPFQSFSVFDYELSLSSKGVSWMADESSGRKKLVIRNRPYLAVTLGNGFKGHYYCSEMSRSLFLPGDRYFLSNLPSCGNYNGRLLIDTITGKYQRLPAGTVVYLTLNTDTHPHYVIDSWGIAVK
jgi:hypothetical protein